MGYHYKAYGINLDSEIICPELAIADGSPDARVTIDQIPAFWNPDDRLPLEYKIEDHTILFSLRGTASFAIQDGKTVIVDPDGCASMDAVRYYLLHSAMCCLMYQRGLLVLHGSVIETPSGAVVFSGLSGSGKSTLAAAFARRGYRILSDDVCTVCHQRGIPFVRPSFPQIKLGSEAAAYLGYPDEGAQVLEVDGRKLGLPMDRGFRKEDLKLFRLYELLRTAEDKEFNLKTLAGAGKLVTIMRNLYRSQILDHSGFLAALSARAVLVAQAIEIKQMMMPAAHEWASLQALVDFLERDFCK